LIARYGSQIRDIFIGPTLDHKDLPIHEIIRDLPMLERIRVGHKCIANDVDSIATLFPNIKYADLDLVCVGNKTRALIFFWCFSEL
jgi:hypothetical protein